MSTALATGLRQTLDELVRAHRPAAPVGRVPDSIPHLHSVDPTSFGIAVATVDGEVTSAGDADVPFSIQSISKVFSLSLALRHDPGQTLWQRVLREPSGTAFNSLVQLEAESGIPRNPFINAGALVVTDFLLEARGDACGEVLAFLRALSGSTAPAVDEAASAAELGSSSRNFALANFLADFGNLRRPVPEVVEHYVRHCSITMSCRDLARAGVFLADAGRGAPAVATPSAVLSAEDTRRVNSIMLTCGMYDAAGEFAYRVGLPGKSGVGGGILAVAPGRGAVCVWSPGLDAKGNSVAGSAALADLSSRIGWSIF
ncbi:glutaminase [Sinomonas cellulolyticus]|jgi:glutaminase|uniref:Glutaminase n=1 Tax=Sinomonas cellulolyticus TaxID=2801916 RepID=A0ABS1K5A4_9MICC|nr:MULTISPECIES: glutaminase [Sinomonas]MBL0706864.1 glutaminase [Sinomonas cellulolyticus]GHG52866.1 glutaminase [Sinomonas sp. KCTC 49339]